MILTEKLIGNKITCYIDGRFIPEAEIHYESYYFYILQNYCEGSPAKDKKAIVILGLYQIREI